MIFEGSFQLNYYVLRPQVGFGLVSTLGVLGNVGYNYRKAH